MSKRFFSPPLSLFAFRAGDNVSPGMCLQEYCQWRLREPMLES